MRITQMDYKLPYLRPNLRKFSSTQRSNSFIVSSSTKSLRLSRMSTTLARRDILLTLISSYTECALYFTAFVNLSRLSAILSPTNQVLITYPNSSHALIMALIAPNRNIRFDTTIYPKAYKELGNGAILLGFLTLRAAYRKFVEVKKLLKSKPAFERKTQELERIIVPIRTAINAFKKMSLDTVPAGILSDIHTSSFMNSLKILKLRREQLTEISDLLFVEDDSDKLLREKAAAKLQKWWGIRKSKATKAGSTIIVQEPKKRHVLSKSEIKISPLVQRVSANLIMPLVKRTSVSRVRGVPQSHSVTSSKINILLTSCKNANSLRIVPLKNAFSQSDLNFKDQYGFSPLIYATKANSHELIQFLIDKGADINLEGQNGNTPLHYAFKNLDMISIKMLVDAGADLNKLNNQGMTPLGFGTPKLLSALNLMDGVAFVNDRSNYHPKVIDENTPRDNNLIFKKFVP